MADVKHVIGIGRLNDNVNTATPPVLTPAFTFDRIDITFDTLMRTFDESID